MGVTSTQKAKAILALGSVALFYAFAPALSADFLAVWLAGKFMAMDQPDQIYPAVTEYFQMYPPAGWRPFMAAEYGYESAVYPFLYPPLWAKVAALFSDTDYRTVALYLLMLNCAALMLTIWLAWRATGSRLDPVLFSVLGVAFLCATYVGFAAVYQGQPQILVTFLVVLAIERSRHAAPLSAGASLALAASIKLYPALFAAYWLASGNRRALAAFGFVGAALALTSVAWAGWPLHLAFLDQLRLISTSVFITPFSINLDAVVAQTFFADDLRAIPLLQSVAEGTKDSIWLGMVRPEAWRWISNLLLLSGFGLTLVYYRRSDHDTRHALVWPLGLTLVSLLMPFTWIYYFAASAAFAPVLLDRPGRATGSLYCAASFLPISFPATVLCHLILDDSVSLLAGYQQTATLSFCILTAGFWHAVCTARAAPRTDRELRSSGRERHRMPAESTSDL